MSAAEVVTRWTTDVETALRGAAPIRDSLLARMASYHMGWIQADGRPAAAGGKRLRPSLCSWAAAAGGADPRNVLPAACAIELVHNFTLVHDDVQEGDLTRHGRPTVWSLRGSEQAINVGDYLFAQACQVMLAGAERSRTPDRGRRISAAQVVLDAVVEVIEGQVSDLEHEGRPAVGRDGYLEMVEANTGALIGASLEARAVPAGASAQVRARLRRAGRRLGIAFQLRDDWLGVWGEMAVTRKSSQSDLVRRKLTYPVVLAPELGSPRQRQRLVALYQPRGEAAEPDIRRLLGDLATGELTAETAASHTRQAVAEVRHCHLNPPDEEEFADVAHYVAERNR